VRVPTATTKKKNKLARTRMHILTETFRSAARRTL
jgi:hypothetical protein